MASKTAIRKKLAKLRTLREPTRDLHRQIEAANKRVSMLETEAGEVVDALSRLADYVATMHVFRDMKPADWPGELKGALVLVARSSGWLDKD